MQQFAVRFGKQYGVCTRKKPTHVYLRQDVPSAAALVTSKRAKLAIFYGHQKSSGTAETGGGKQPSG